MFQGVTENFHHESSDGGNNSQKAASSLYTMVDLFAGCGGLSMGFENAQFTPVFVNELDKDAIQTYLKNRYHELGGEKFAENADLRCNDAHELQGERLEQLVSDLSSLKEADFRFDTATADSGGGSTLDVLAGGPPCQGYSGIGIRRSYAVDRKEIPANVLYGRMAQIIRRLRPRIFLFENVRGLLNAKWTREGGEPIWPDVKAEFRNIPGYEVRWSLVYAKDYGVPQNRPRVLLVGIRKDILDACPSIDANADPEDAVKCGFLPEGQPGTFPHLNDLLGDLVDPGVADTLRSGKFAPGTFETTSYPRPARTAIQKHLRSSPPWDPNGQVRLTEQEYSKHKWAVVDKFDHMLTNNGEIPQHYQTRKFSQRVLPPHWGNKEPHMTATSLPDDYVHYCQPRILTVREWARLQLFPDWYRFAGKRTTGGIRRAGNPLEGIYDREVPKYTQIGNAVPVGLAQKVGEHFRGILDQALGER
ncbi:DNA (cytosine-5)-methyltransferase 1 [Rubricella aquisinus]|uniref:Cytosine-specific methyltransferase n=1 Tax=Rubricella aquisinus TaxID=2028108 RepID=A0A840WNS9_9RHOB|nr:DNA (cytosine-5)-methyltransferase 1 [Rubricella aquisinus]